MILAFFPLALGALLVLAIPLALICGALIGAVSAALGAIVYALRVPIAFAALGWFAWQYVFHHIH